MTGTIRMIEREKGWGFIASDDGMPYFFHRSALVQRAGARFDRLRVNDRVSFEPNVSNSKGPCARRVSLGIANQHETKRSQLMKIDLSLEKVCGKCHGAGSYAQSTCPACGGSG